MRSFVLTEDAAREIVKAGTPKKYRSTQIVRKPTLVETPQKPEEEIKVPEIFLATVAASWTQNDSRNAEITITYCGRDRFRRRAFSVVAGKRLACGGNANTCR